MAPEISAGAVLVELRAQYQDLKKNVQGAKAEMTGFGAGVDATAKKVAASGQQISNSFDAMDKAGARAMARFARLTGVLFAAQNVFQSFAGEGQQNKGVAAASAGLSTFAGVALALPHPVGIALAAIAGLGTGFATFAKQVGEAAEGVEKIKQAIAQVESRRLSIAERKAAADVFGASEGERLSIEIDDLAGKLDASIRKIAKLKESNRFGNNPGADDEIEEIKKRIEADVKLLGAKRRDLLAAEAVKDRTALEEQNKTLLDSTKIQLEAGLISPIQALEVEARAARAELDKLLADPNRDMTALGLALDKAKSTQGKVDAARRLDGLAEGFGSSVSSALSDAILNQRKPSEALANLMGGLFESSLSEAMKQVQTGLAAAFKAATGGSDLLGGVFTAALGIGGGLFAQRANKSSESFSGVKSIVTDSTPVRGIVAGPANVAVATLGNDLTRSMAPVVQRLDMLVRVCAETARNTRQSGGSSTAGGEAIVGIPTA